MNDEGIFLHKCNNPDCPVIVEFDDEPYCFTHSPDEGSSLPGYSARRAAKGKVTVTNEPEISVRNIFDQYQDGM